MLGKRSRIRLFTFTTISFCFMLLALSSCREDERRVGCTDPRALNYDPLAEISSNTCEYPQKTQMIWNNGLAGSWEDEQFTGAILISTCFGYLGFDTLTPDSTTEIPVMVLSRDEQDRFGMKAEITNRRDVDEYTDGFLLFDVMLADSNNVITFNTYLHGTNCPHTNCDATCTSERVAIATNNLNDSTFTTVVVPLSEYVNKSLLDMNLVFAINDTIGSGNDTVMFIRNIFWKTELD